MTQPPDEPTQGRADQGWQPPGPTPPPQQPVQQPVQPPVGPSAHNPYGEAPPPNPYGGGTTNYYQPIDSGGMSRNVKIVLGVLIGVFGGFILWFVAAIVFAADGSGSESAFLFFAAVAPLVVPAPLLIWKATRPWAVGLLMGTAVASIGMSSLCSALINSFEGGA